MPEEFEGLDLTEAVFWGVDLSRARFRDANLSGATITHSRLADVTIDGFVERLVINGVDVTEHVNASDRWYPLRAMLHPTDRAGRLAAWDALGTAWAPVIEQARSLTTAQQHESVGGEWSFVTTMRHLVFAMDKWFSHPIAGDACFHPFGVSNSGSVDSGWPGIDRSSDPSLEEVLAVRAAQAERFRAYLADAADTELPGEATVLENGVVPVQDCLYVVLEEEFEHLRYAVRDLAQLG